ncbi:MAS3 protein [Magnaporthiopsis poae ATCC 64411]|uniref:MAS3 protein n=1 Tax=Magnaporthiopsis poae (strain ATCC 64411 / 73-15) TaxID=644358 RepID=A0A0C4E8L9_MAGP6|nr:MAS3 protein [Magnaporthiopsis poae ATCC 64411]
MRYSSTALIAAFAATNVLGHGVVTEVQGANGVNLPGLSLIDGTPRDCPSPRCGSEADTSIIRDRELGTNRASALGRTQGGGPVNAAAMVQLFMDDAGANTTEVKQARVLHAANLARRAEAAADAPLEARQLLGLLLGGKGKGKGKGGVSAAGVSTPQGTKETAVLAATGMGAAQGLPTTSDDGTLRMMYHQVNQDGAGPLTADIDATSGGTETSAFKKAEVTMNVPGLGIGGLSAAQTMDFPVEVKMPAGMTCQGQVAGATGVCIARLRNSALAGPFGGSVAFTQSPAAKKRAIEYNLRKRMLSKRFAAAVADEKVEEDEE